MTMPQWDTDRRQRIIGHFPKDFSRIPTLDARAQAPKPLPGRLSRTSPRPVPTDKAGSLKALSQFPLAGLGLSCFDADGPDRRRP